MKKLLSFGVHQVEKLLSSNSSSQSSQYPSQQYGQQQYGQQPPYAGPSGYSGPLGPPPPSHHHHGQPFSHIPYSSLPGGLTIQQCETIMSLVSIAENSTTNWWQNYAYCEDIKDGRGITVSLVGFCSGTGDLLWVLLDLQRLQPNHPLTHYIPAVESVNGSKKTRGLGRFATDLKKYDDQSWRQAVWDGIMNFYWVPAMDFAMREGCRSALAKGFLFDLALNHGAEEMTVMAKRVSARKPCHGGDEGAWLFELIQVRERIIVHEDQSTNSGQPDRCRMFAQILREGNFDLCRPIRNLTCYGDKFDIV
ncbi:lysozyme-like domain-containing protein [Phlyctochytrium arcticum]|nr:lysozyme-like domain-containing protein [Phlyctochytrium arcticum]